MYVCSKCKKEITELEPKFTRCPHCASRQVYKMRQPIAKEVSSD